MWITPTILYWSSVGVVAYTYLGYPLLISTLSKLRPRGVRAAPGVYWLEGRALGRRVSRKIVVLK